MQPSHDPVELYLEWTEGSWVLWTPRDHNRNKEILSCFAGILNDAVPLAEIRARSYSQGASLTVITFLGNHRRSETRHFSPH